MPTTLTNGIQLPDKGSVDWYSSMQSNYNLIDTHLGDTDIHVTAEDKANWDSKQGSLSQDQLDAISQVATNTNDIATLQTDKADASHTHSSSDITDIDDYATKQYVDNSISGLVDNAPDALNTLNELSAALNDDSNFASTVTTALAAKADSADLATVATSGSYTDLTDKPTINDSTITIQKNGSTVDTFTTNGSNKTIDIPVPTKTSDLTNDSDFVVSSSLATVATSGFYNDLDNKPTIPSKISDLIDDSNFVDIFNPAVSSGITSAKVTSYDSHIADTDIHVTTADKSTWNTVISKANDSDVVHKSGNETVGGVKSFSDNTYIKSLNVTNEVASPSSSSSAVMPIVTTVTYTDQTASTSARINLRITASGDKSLYPHENNQYALGLTSRKWSEVHATTYYYGSSDTEFSDKFVTTDTAQTIGQNKTFTGVITINHAKGGIFQLTCPDLDNTIDVTGNWAEFISFNSVDGGQTVASKGAVGLRQFKNGKNFALLLVEGSETLYFGSKSNLDSTKALYPANSGVCSLGTSTNKWQSINGLNPSSLGMPDLNNGIDISSYITVRDNANVQSTYTPPSNGWVCVKLSRTSGSCAVLLQQENICGYGRNINLLDGTTIACSSIPVIKGVQVLINSALANGVVSAYFYPCLGNV